MSTTAALADARGRRWLAASDPRLKLVWLLWVSTLSVLLDSPPALAALFGLAAAGAAGLRMRPRGWSVVLGLLLVVAWSTLLSQALFYDRLPRTPWITLLPAGEVAGWSFPGLRLYREGALYGLAQSLRMLSVTLAGLTVCLSTSPERLLSALGRLKVPVAIGFMAVTALRFLPLLVSEWNLVRQARRLRGYRTRWTTVLAPGRWPAMVRMELSLLLPVLSSALRRATALATSVASRGFDPAAPRTFYPQLTFRTSERLLLLLLSSSAAAVGTAKVLYWMYASGLHYHSSLRSLYTFVRLYL